MTAAIAFDFDPYLRLGDGVVRWETHWCRRRDLRRACAGWDRGADDGAPRRRPDLHRPRDRSRRGHRGRLGYVLLHRSYFGANPGAILDPVDRQPRARARGRRRGADGRRRGRTARQLDRTLVPISALPVLVALGAGKLALVLGGRDQGLPWDARGCDRIPRARSVGFARAGRPVGTRRRCTRVSRR